MTAHANPRASRRLRAPLLAALLLASLPSLAQERIQWPLTWKAGQQWTYDTESLDREIDDGAPQVTRSSDVSEVRIAEAGPTGFVQHWVTRDSRIEAVEGDRSMTDAIAPLLDEFEGYVVKFELGPDGRYRGMRNLEETAIKVRKVMLPITGVSMDQLAAELDPSMPKADRDAVVALARRNLEAMMEKFFTLEMVEAMTSGGVKGLTTFVGGDYEAGKRYRDAEPIESPLLGRRLPAQREYVFSIDKEDPRLARVDWTHTLDTSGDPAALWQLVSELTSGGLQTTKATGRPQGLVLREEGYMLFDRRTGVVEMLESTVVSRYGVEHDERDRNRMRLRGSDRQWPADAPRRRGR